MKIIDLSHPISNKMSTYPSDPEVSFKVEKEIDKDHTLLHSFSMGTHTATHLDTPSHIISGGKTINDFHLRSFYGITIKVDKNSFNLLEKLDYSINGIIYNTSWYRNINDPKIFYGGKRPTIPKKLIQIAQTLKINFFGCDLPSVDSKGSTDKLVHRSFLENDIIIYESLTNLDKLPSLKPFEFYGFPLPFDNLDGSPVRAVGII